MIGQRPSVACCSSRLFSTYLPLDLGPDFSSDCYSSIDLMRETTQMSINHLHQTLHMGGKAMELHVSTSEPTSCMEEDAREAIKALTNQFRSTHRSSSPQPNSSHGRDGHKQTIEHGAEAQIDSPSTRHHHWILDLSLGPQILLLPSSDGDTSEGSTLFAAKVNSSQWKSSPQSKSSLMTKSSLPPLTRTRLSGSVLSPWHYWTHSSHSTSAISAPSDPTWELEELSAMIHAVLAPMGIKASPHVVQKKGGKSKGGNVKDLEPVPSSVTPPRWIPHVNFASALIPFDLASRAFESVDAALSMRLSKSHEARARCLVVRWGEEAHCIEWP